MKKSVKIHYKDFLKLYVKEDKMVAIIGLGNPEKKYEHTRHNMGFMAIDFFAKKHNIQFSKNKYHAMFGEGQIEGEKVLLLKPTTYMNLSGLCVQDLVHSLKLDLSKIIVLVDDIDIDFLALRLRAKGSAGTHNGLKNIVAQLNSTEFARLRIGVGQDKSIPLIDFVLKNFNENELTLIQNRMEDVDKILVDFIKFGGDVTRIKYDCKATK